MRRIGFIISFAILLGACAAAWAADGVEQKAEGGQNYCHIKVPAMRTQFGHGHAGTEEPGRRCH